jgi:hypothetical protein
MKQLSKSIIPVFLLLAFTPGLLPAAETSIDSLTMIRFGQHEKHSIIPATEFLGLDVNKLADGNLSLHFYGWGRAHLADNSYNDDKTEGSLTYAFLQYRIKDADADVRAGRLFVHEGIINEQIDGVSARTSLPAGFGISAFGGATVHTKKLFAENNDGKGDYIYGGRASYRFKGMLELGVSGLYESNAPTLVNYINGNHRLVGADIWLSPHKTVDLVGHSSYNTETSKFAEHTYLLNIRPISRLLLSGEFNEYRDRSFLYSWSMFSGAGLNPADKSRSTGLGASYAISKGIEAAADYKHYTRETGSADRSGGNLKLTFMDNSVRCGVGYHYLKADKSFALSGNSSASYQELRGYAMHDSKNYFAAIDLLGLFFKDKIYNESSALEAVLSLGYHLTPTLALSGDVSYGKNPQFTDETRGIVRLTYNALFEGKGGKK